MAHSSQRVVSVGCEDGHSHPLLLGRAQFVQGAGHLCPYFVSLTGECPWPHCARRERILPNPWPLVADDLRRSLSRSRRKRPPYRFGSLTDTRGGHPRACRLRCSLVRHRCEHVPSHIRWRISRSDDLVHSSTVTARTRFGILPSLSRLLCRLHRALQPHTCRVAVAARSPVGSVPTFPLGFFQLVPRAGLER
jgi:hypothetical protein